MEDEVEVIEKPVDDIGADIAKAMDEVADVKEPERAEDGKFKAETPEEPAPEPVKEIPQAPQSWTAEAKAEWAKAPDKIRAEVLKREQDMHQALTRHDGELRLGRDMKEIVTPYLPIIQAEGGTPQTAVRDLLNTAYVLRTGSTEQKRALILNTAKQYGVDLGVQEESEYVDPMLASLRQEIEQLKQIANPQAVESRLRSQLESDRMQADIVAFASDPAHVHFESVRDDMAHYVRKGASLKEAYDMACNASPQIRSTLEAAKAAELEAKRKQEIALKKRAASSITGSPAVPSNSKVTNPKTSVEDDLRAAFDELESKI
jgi:hypothetical protein